MDSKLSLLGIAQAFAGQYDHYSLYVSTQGGIPFPTQLSTGKCRKKRSNKLHRSRMLKRKHARK